MRRTTRRKNNNNLHAFLEKLFLVCCPPPRRWRSGGRITLLAPFVLFLCKEKIVFFKMGAASSARGGAGVRARAPCFFFLRVSLSFFLFTTQSFRTARNYNNNDDVRTLFALSRTPTAREEREGQNKISARSTLSAPPSSLSLSKKKPWPPRAASTRRSPRDGASTRCAQPSRRAHRPGPSRAAAAAAGSRPSTASNATSATSRPGIATPQSRGTRLLRPSC